MTDSTGLASFTVETPNSVAIGQSISATATDPSCNTPEYAPDVTVTTAGTATGLASSAPSADYSQSVTLTASVTAATAGLPTPTVARRFLRRPRCQPARTR